MTSMRRRLRLGNGTSSGSLLRSYSPHDRTDCPTARAVIALRLLRAATESTCGNSAEMDPLGGMVQEHQCRRYHRHRPEDRCGKISRSGSTRRRRATGRSWTSQSSRKSWVARSSITDQPPLIFHPDRSAAPKASERHWSKVVSSLSGNTGRRPTNPARPISARGCSDESGRCRQRWAEMLDRLLMSAANNPLFLQFKEAVALCWSLMRAKAPTVIMASAL